MKAVLIVLGTFVAVAVVCVGYCCVYYAIHGGFPNTSAELTPGYWVP